ncbi:MAG: LysE family translocator, partial [Chloroflexi bacterium]|nr:LysE family translocator [Chloroflexota bacterium]
AAPVGPVGVLCIRRSMTHGFRSGLVSGLGAASADAVYGTIAAAGLTLVADVLVRQQMWLGLLGGGFLLYLGVKTFASKSAVEAAKQEHVSISGDYFSTLLLTLSNPMTIFSFAAIFSGMSAQTLPVFRFSAFLLVLGVFLGSASWWLILSGSVGLLRSRVTSTLIGWINRISGLVIIGFAIFLISRTIVTR